MWEVLLVIVGAQGFWALVTEIWRHKQEKKKDKVNPSDIFLMKEAIVAMLHDRLYQACRFYLSKGEIDEDGYANLETLYKTYHGLGGNSTGTELYNRASKLKIVESIDNETV